MRFGHSAIVISMDHPRERERERGIQPPAWAMNSNAKSEDDEESRDAVNHLMRPQMESLESGLTHKEHVQETNKAAIEESDYKNSEGLLKRRKMMMDLETSVKDAVIVGTTTDKFKCRTCNKCFPSHQALGGHTAGHNKSRGPYKCNVCYKTFPSYRALRGHMSHRRSHKTTPAQAPPTRVQSASQSGRRFLEIDLNKPPPMEVDEEYHGGIQSEHEAAQNGYVSSSANSHWELHY